MGTQLQVLNKLIQWAKRLFFLNVLSAEVNNMELSLQYNKFT